MMYSGDRCTGSQTGLGEHGRKRLTSLLHCVLGVVLVTGLVTTSAWGDGTLNFTGQVNAGTCELTVSPASIDFGEVDPTAFQGQIQWYGMNTRDFTVKLASCSGVGGSSLTPAVQITGTLSDDSGIPTGTNKWLFKTGGTSRGFGVVVYNATPPNPGINEAENNEWIAVPGYGSGKTIPSAGVEIPLAAAVACGRSAWCAVANQQPGSLDATVSFTFAYH